MARTIAKDYDDKRQLILDRAAQLFADEGFDRASVSQVAQACEISKANIYHYYGSKDEILFDILNQHLASLKSRILEMDLAGQDAQSRFRLTLREILLAYQGADNEHRLQSNAIGYLPKEQQGILREYQRELVAHMSDCVEVIAPDVFLEDPEKLRAATMSVFGMLNWFYMWNRNADKREREAYADTVYKLCIGGIPAL